MATHLLELNDRTLSLELAPDDRPKVGQLIRQLYGEPRVVEHAVSSTYSFGHTDIEYWYEGDDHCLMANSESGNIILRRLFEALASR